MPVKKSILFGSVLILAACMFAAVSSNAGAKDNTPTLLIAPPQYTGISLSEAESQQRKLTATLTKIGILCVEPKNGSSRQSSGSWISNAHEQSANGYFILTMSVDIMSNSRCDIVCQIIGVDGSIIYETTREKGQLDRSIALIREYIIQSQNEIRSKLNSIEITTPKPEITQKPAATPPPVQHLPPDDSVQTPRPRPPEMAGVLPETDRQTISLKNHWVALLIGISDYSNTNGYANSLDGVPTRDVRRLAELLRSEYSFDRVDVLIDGEATRRAILSALKRLHDVPVDTNVLIYYAGHGLLSDDGIGIWVPCDARDEVDCVTNSVIRDHIKNMPARRVLLVSDSCFSGSFLTRGVDVKALPGAVVDRDQSVEISRELVGNLRPGREVITSGNLAPVPNSGFGPCRDNSPFACTLLTALEAVPRGAAVSTTDLYVEAYKSLSELYKNDPNRPRPQRATLEGHAGGEFFFVRSEQQNPSDMP